jgi:hypothetical protein
MIHYSDRESKLFGTRLGRVDLSPDFGEWDKLSQEASALQLDYLRVKIESPAADLLQHLAQQSARYYHIGVIKLYKMRVDKPLTGEINPNIVFRKVEPTDKTLFKNIVLDTYTDTPMGFFHHPEVDRDFPLALQLENISSYLADYFSGIEPNKVAYIGYVAERPVACFASEYNDSDGIVTTYYAGILAEYRDKGLFGEMIRFYKQLSCDRGMRYSKHGARIENLASQFAMEKEGSFCYGHEWVYMLCYKK